MATATPASIRVWEAHFAQYRSIMLSNMFGAFVQPFMYLLGMGLGVGALVDGRSQSADILGGLTYFEFLAPGLLATTAMMIGAQAGLYPVLGGFKWEQTFHAQAAAPLSPGDIVGGILLFDATRCAIGVVGVASVLALFDGTRSLGLLATIPFGVLTGVAFAAPLTAWTARCKDETSLSAILRFGITPLFLFGGAFFPVSQLPDWIQPLAVATPLWHGVELCRGSVHGTLSLSQALLHVIVLLVYIAVGWFTARRAFWKRLSL